jgi:hypothetical protein
MLANACEPHANIRSAAVTIFACLISRPPGSITDRELPSFLLAGVEADFHRVGATFRTTRLIARPEKAQLTS